MPTERTKAQLGDTEEYVEAIRYSECMDKLVNNEVDAITSYDIILAGLAASDEYYGLVRLLDAPTTEESLMIGLPPGATETCEKVTAALNDMVADGSWQRFIEVHTAGIAFTPNPLRNPPETMPCK